MAGKSEHCIDLSAVPKDPGCYQFLDEKGIILYIGKAKNLRKRVSSYFQKRHEDEKTRQLVSRIHDVKFFVTKTETESLILETNLIKKHIPKYNIDLKDSKRYAYLELTDEEFPRLLLARSRIPGKRYYGPFVSSVTRDFIHDFLIRTFRIRTCRRLPKKECLRYHLGLCDAPCTCRISKEDYHENIRKAQRILNGHADAVIDELRSKMKSCAAEKDYENALQLRNQIHSLEYLEEKQNMELQRVYDEDIVNFTIRREKDADKAYLILFNIRKGMMENKQEFEFDATDGFFEEFIVRFYSENKIPKEIISPVKLSPSVMQYLESIAKHKVKVTVPTTGSKKDLLDLVCRNIEVSFFGGITQVEALKKELKLNEEPSVIECFDISHLGGTNTVASMVSFRDGKPDKSNYRRFKIRTVSGVDDFASIGEVIRRRYSRLQKENAAFPNLIVVDGGKGQLTYAVEELKKLGIQIPIISLAKEFEEIFVPGSKFPVRLDRKSPALHLLQQVRDEAHRFAIAYNRLLRTKEMRDA